MDIENLNLQELREVTEKIKKYMIEFDAIEDDWYIDVLLKSVQGIEFIEKFDTNTDIFDRYLYRHHAYDCEIVEKLEHYFGEYCEKGCSDFFFSNIEENYNYYLRYEDKLCNTCLENIEKFKKKYENHVLDLNYYDDLAEKAIDLKNEELKNEELKNITKKIIKNINLERYETLENWEIDTLVKTKQGLDFLEIYDEKHLTDDVSDTVLCEFHRYDEYIILEIENVLSHPECEQFLKNVIEYYNDLEKYEKKICKRCLEEIEEIKKRYNNNNINLNYYKNFYNKAIDLEKI